MERVFEGINYMQQNCKESKGAVDAEAGWSLLQEIKGWTGRMVKAGYHQALDFLLRLSMLLLH